MTMRAWEEPDEYRPVESLWHSDPTIMVRQVSKQSSALADVIKTQGLSTRISGRDHVNIEGWQTVGAMVGVFAVIEWTRPLLDDDGTQEGWEARAQAVTRAGEVVGAAEAECRRSESTWANRDSYALRSMAQTRAMSRALRGALGFIVAMAGYSATPEEEMHAEMTPSQKAKHYALQLTGGNKTKAKELYSTALKQAEVDAVRSDEDADAVVAALTKLQEPFEEAEVVDGEAG